MATAKCAVCFTVLLVAVGASSSLYCAIRVVDNETGEGVPLVRLSTSTYITLYTDSAGVAAFYEPGMMDQQVWFTVLTDGYIYEQNADPPYDPGAVVFTASGGAAELRLNRTQHARRMFRLTGAGLYRDSVLVGDPVPATAQARAVADPVSRSAAQDTVMTAVFKSRVFWTFGDTVCPSDRRQGNCHSTGMYTVGATSPLSQEPGGPPELAYFGANGSIHPMAPVLPLSRNTWISALSVVDAGQPSERMFATYIKPSTGGGPDPLEYEGVASWNQTASQFQELTRWPNASTKRLSLNGAQTVQLLSPEDSSSRYIYYAGAAVYARAPKASIGQYSSYEVLGPNREWVPVDSAPAVPVGSGLSIGGGTVNWNQWAGRYLFLATGGPGDAVYIAFSHSLVGPFENATKVASHSATGSSCYNGAHLPHMDRGGGRVVSFGCTFTAMWSNGPAGAHGNSWGACLFGLNGSKAGCSAVVPRYEYNNLVYEVDLSDFVDPAST